MHELFMEHLLRIGNILNLNDPKLSQTYVDVLIRIHLFLLRQIVFFKLLRLIFLFQSFFIESFSFFVGSLDFLVESIGF
jgi:hypothetical protein